MKKLLILTLACLVALGLLSGCTSSNKPAGTDTPATEDNKVLKISGLNGGYGTAGWEAVVAAFEEATGYTVELTLEKNIADILRPVVNSGRNLPDLIYLSVGSTGGLVDTMIASEQIEEITDVLDMKVYGEETLVKDKILPGFTSSFSTMPYGDGKLYLAPISYDPCGLFYNAALFKEKGWEVPQTWDEMFALGDKALAEGYYLFTYPTVGYFDAFFSALLNATAGEEVYSRLMEYDLDAWKLPEVRAAFDIVGRLANYIEPSTVANANGEGFRKNQALVIQNKALFIPNGTWLPGEEAKDGPVIEHEFEWGMAPIPAASEGGLKYSATFSEQVYIPKGAENVAGAKEFMTFLYSDTATKLFAENSGMVVPTAEAPSFLPDTANEDGTPSKITYYSMYEDGTTAGCTVGFKAVEAIEGVMVGTENGVLYSTVNSVMTGDKTVDEWYDAVLAAVEQYANQQ